MLPTDCFDQTQLAGSSENLPLDGEDVALTRWPELALLERAWNEVRSAQGRGAPALARGRRGGNCRRQDQRVSRE